jgi:hypothetical protein
VVFGSRVRFALIVLASQILLIALAVMWLVQMVLIASNGSISFVEHNQAVLWFEVVLSTLICLFAIIVFAMQLRKLGERRKNDKKRD